MDYFSKGFGTYTMTSWVSLRDANILCFDKCKIVQVYFKLVNQFLSQSSVIQAPANEKDSLNIQEVKTFLNLRLFPILGMLN